MFRKVQRTVEVPHVLKCSLRLSPTSWADFDRVAEHDVAPTRSTTGRHGEQSIEVPQTCQQGLECSGQALSLRIESSSVSSASLILQRANLNINALDHLKKYSAFVGNTEHFDKKIDLAGSEGLESMKVVNVKHQKIFCLRRRSLCTRVGFRLIAEFRIRPWPSVPRDAVFLRGPGAAAAYLLRNLR